MTAAQQRQAEDISGRLPVHQAIFLVERINESSSAGEAREILQEARKREILGRRNPDLVAAIERALSNLTNQKTQ